MRQINSSRERGKQLSMSEPELPRLLTIPEVARILQIGENTLRNKSYREQLGLSVIKIGRAIRFSRDDVDEFIRRNVQGRGTLDN